MTSIFSFSPVPSQRRRADGWTPKKQAIFIEALAEFGIVSAAAQRAGMGRASVYNLRNKPGAESFAAAWEAAQQIGFEKLQDIAMDRAINGESVPYFYQGEMVGERRRYDNRLLVFMLQQTLARRFGQSANESRKKEAIVITAQQNAAERAKQMRTDLIAKLELMSSRQRGRSQE
jgi:hypothetical protein